MVWLPILFPLAGAAAVSAFRRRRSWLGPISLLALVGSLFSSVVVAVARADFTWRWGGGIEVGLAAEGAGTLMVIVVPLVALAVVGYAGSSMSSDPGLARLLALMIAFVAAMQLLVLAADFLTLLIGWELVGAASWALIGHDWHNPKALASAREAFVTTRFGDVGLYLAAGAAFAASGSFRFSALSEGVDAGWLAVVAGGVVLAAAAKSAQVPFSPWLFSAMAGPTPVSALLHSATMVAAGAYALIRLEPVLAPVEWFGPLVVGLGLVTALAGGLVAFAQTDFKMALAGSTSAQYGLMLLAIGAGFTAAGMGQLTAHAFFKALLFIGAGVALHSGGTLDLGNLRLGTALPRVALLFGVGAAALAAVPPLGAAFTKELILAASFESAAWVGAGATVAGLISAMYASRLHLLAYGPARSVPSPAAEPLGRWEAAPMVALALLTLALSVLWLPGGAEWLAEVTDGGIAEGEPWEFGLSVATIVVGFGFVWMLWQRGRLVSGGMPERLRAFIAGWWGIPIATQRLIVDPIIDLSHRLARGDDSVTDAGVRGVARAVTGTSQALRKTVERAVDRVVETVGAGTLGAAALSQQADDSGVDAAVEGIAVGVGLSGEQARRSQTGMSHHYYTLLVIGFVLVVAVAMWR